PIVQAALGLYPLDAPNVELRNDSQDYDRSCTKTVDETLKQVKAHARDIVAIGEVGMDLKYSDDEQHQLANFMKFVRLANQLKKPLIIHSRKAEKHVLDLLEDAKVNNAVLHCFSGGRKLIKRAVELGLRLTVTSNANRLQHFQMLARDVPLGQLLTETDAPYLSPVRGERNEPQNVRVAVETIAKMKGLNADEVARNIFLNYTRTFPR
ncbi:TatD family deoxyribonuclease, partial [Candidatus Woesearchaeota archaeon]